MKRENIRILLTLLMLVSTMTACDKTKCEHIYGTLIQRNDPTCEEEGNIEYYHCEECDTYFNAQKEKIKASSIVIKPTGHSYGDLVLSKESTCAEYGNIAYYHCSDCGKYFNERKEEIDEGSIKFGILSHTYSNVVPRKDPTCIEDGNIAYCHCEGCDQYFTPNRDVIFQSSIVLKATGIHDYDESGNCKVCGANKFIDITDSYKFGKIEKYQIYDNKVYFSFEAKCPNGLFSIDFQNYSSSYVFNLITSMEIYEQGKDINLVNEYNYVSYKDFGTWINEMYIPNVEVGKKYNVILSISDRFNEGSIIELGPYIYSLTHFLDCYGVCETCGEDASYKLSLDDNGHYIYNSEKGISLVKGEDCYFTASLDSGKYALLVNGKEYDSSKYEAYLNRKCEDGSFIGLQYKDGCYDVQTDDYFGLAIYPCSDYIINSVELIKK